MKPEENLCRRKKIYLLKNLFYKIINCALFFLVFLIFLEDGNILGKLKSLDRLYGNQYSDSVIRNLLIKPFIVKFSCLRETCVQREPFLLKWVPMPIASQTIELKNIRAECSELETYENYFCGCPGKRFFIHQSLTSLPSSP